MAILATIAIFYLLPLVWRGMALLVRLALAAVLAQVVVRLFPEALALLQGVLPLALIAGTMLLMVGGLSRK